MSSLFIQQLVLSMVIAGLWISAATLFSERLGSKLGGMISNMPSTILVSLLFIGLTQGANFAAEATSTVPLGMSLSTIFLFTFIALVPRGLGKAVAASLAAWLVLALLSSLFQGVGRIGWTLVYFLVAVTTYLLAEKVLNIPSMGRTGKRYTIRQALLRALFAGSVVGTAVLVARTGSAFWTGIFSTFPAVMLSSMVILSLSAGAPFARATGKIMLLASTNIVIYGYLSGLLFPVIGLAWGSIIPFFVSVGWIWLLRPLFKRGR
jgi:hypothetical protein